MTPKQPALCSPLAIDSETAGYDTPGNLSIVSSNGRMLQRQNSDLSIDGLSVGGMSSAAASVATYYNHDAAAYDYYNYHQGYYGVEEAYQGMYHAPSGAHSRSATATSNTSELSEEAADAKVLAALSPKTPPPNTLMHHTQLLGHITYVPFPPADTLKPVQNGRETKHALFFGQLKFEASLELLVWLVEVLTDGEVRPVHLHRRGSGCAMVHFANKFQAHRLMALNETVLFDHQGVWIARCPSEVDLIQRYSRHLQKSASTKGLPRGGVVIRR